MSERNESETPPEPLGTPVSPDRFSPTLEQSIKDSKESGSGNPIANDIAKRLAQGGNPDPDYADRVAEYMKQEDR